MAKNTEKKEKVETIDVNQIKVYLVDVKNHSLSEVMAMNDNELKAMYAKYMEQEKKLAELKANFKEQVKKTGLDSNKAYDSIVIAVLFDMIVSGKTVEKKQDIVASISQHATGKPVSDASATTSRYTLLVKAIKAYNELTK